MKDLANIVNSHRKKDDRLLSLWKPITIYFKIINTYKTTMVKKKIYKAENAKQMLELRLIMKFRKFPP